MTSSFSVLQKIEIEKPGLSKRLRSLHMVIQVRYPLISRMALAIYDSKTDLLKTFASSNDDGVALNRYDALLQNVPTLRKLAEQRSARVVNDIAKAFPDASTHTDWLKTQDYRSSYTLPVFSGGELAAFLFFDAKEPDVFTPNVTTFLNDFADIAAQLYLLRMAAVHSLIGTVDVASGLARIRDVETGFHLERMAKYARLIALGVATRFGLTDEYVEYIHLFAPLHDIGKVGVPDRVLLKPGRLNEEEWNIMKRHVDIGTELIQHMVKDMGLEGDLAARIMLNVVRGHHERCDGSGYPAGLKHDDIAIEARVIAVADVYDALSSHRPYKQAWSDEQCLAEMRDEAQAGRLDKDCVAALLAQSVACAEIRHRFADQDRPP